jgi:hypothetical protein
MNYSEWPIREVESSDVSLTKHSVLYKGCTPTESVLYKAIRISMSLGLGLLCASLNSNQHFYCTDDLCNLRRTAHTL